METTGCLCQQTFEAPDLDSLVTVMQRHFDEAHAEMGLSHTQIENYVRAEPRLTGGKERLDEVGEITVEPIGGERLAEILSFFDHDAFADNAGWASCYCVFHHFAGDHAAWGERPAVTNRAEIEERIRAAPPRARSPTPAASSPAG